CPPLLAAAGSRAVWRGTPPGPPRPIHFLSRGTVPTPHAASTASKHKPQSPQRNYKAADVLGRETNCPTNRRIEYIEASRQSVKIIGRSPRELFCSRVPFARIHFPAYIALETESVDLENYAAITNHFPTTFRPERNPFL